VYTIFLLLRAGVTWYAVGACSVITPLPFSFTHEGAASNNIEVNIRHWSSFFSTASIQIPEPTNYHTDYQHPYIPHYLPTLLSSMSPPNYPTT
jgi:hypothetical protein